MLLVAETQQNEKVPTNCVLLKNPSKFRSLVGSLLYLTYKARLNVLQAIFQDHEFTH